VNKILKRKYYALEIELKSPLKVSNGQEIHSDSDVMRNGNGMLFIPGSSLAGAFREYLGFSKDKECIMGYADGEKGYMSSVFISDLYFDNKIQDMPRVSLRDGVSLNDGKIVSNKFDMEIIETGAKGIIFLNSIIREKDSEDDMEQSLYNIFQGIQNGDIRFGSNKTRGFGRMKIINIFYAGFDKDSLYEWIGFMPHRTNLENNIYKIEAYDKWLENNNINKAETKYLKMSISLKLSGGISIRRYSAVPGEADFEHITYKDAEGNKIPVIPGSSWNGAIRADVKEILGELGVQGEGRDDILENWFGYTDSKIKEKTVQSSKVVIAESTIKNSGMLPVSRNKINRFDASTKDGALYSELAYFGGDTCLEFLLYKDQEKQYLALAGMLLLVIEDIKKGYVAVGGQTAVGRGIFEAGEDVKVKYSEEINEEDCSKELYNLIEKYKQNKQNIKG